MQKLDPKIFINQKQDETRQGRTWLKILTPKQML